MATRFIRFILVAPLRRRFLPTAWRGFSAVQANKVTCWHCTPSLSIQRCPQTKGYGAKEQIKH